MAQILNNKPLEYRGEKQPEPGERDANGYLLYPYLPDEEMIEAVNLAIYLERPLLIKGEPGCGKTRLARAVGTNLVYFMMLGISNPPLGREMVSTSMIR